MATTKIESPTSRLNFGYARCDITPPIGIYHRMWGAARKDVATGIHRPLHCDVLVLEPLGGDPSNRHVRILLDFVYLVNSQRDSIIEAVSSATEVTPRAVTVTYSHSHSAGVFEPSRYKLPGGELIEPYLEKLANLAHETAKAALNDLSPATITYAEGHCNMASNRDYFDIDNNIYATGYNPDLPTDNPLILARICGQNGMARLHIVNYGCHPTTLAWENTLISPDFIGSLRETVEQETNVPCCFFQAPCGELGPREGFVGETEIADRNGKQVGHSALATLYSLGKPNHDFHYAGPVISGATVGAWEWRQVSQTRKISSERFGFHYGFAELSLKNLPTEEHYKTELEKLNSAQKEADNNGDSIAARDLGAKAERCRRWIGRINRLPKGPTYRVHFSIHLLGDAAWVTTAAEPYSWLATTLRRRFPTLTMLISPINGDTEVAYLLPRDHYGKGLYQEEPSSLASGCLEDLTDAITESISNLTGFESQT